MSGEDRFFGVGQAARAVGVAPHVLRYWERHFPELRPLRDTRGRRIYRRADIETAVRIRTLVYADGYRIRGAKRRLRGAAAERRAAAAGPAFLRRLLRELRGLERCLP